LKTKEYGKGAVLREDMIPLGKDEGEDPEHSLRMLRLTMIMSRLKESFTLS
jgi:hypothetical protein